MPKRLTVADEARVREVIAANPGMSYRQLATLTGISSATVHRLATAEPADTWVPQPMGSEEHKAAAKALGFRRADELLALTAGNDPFYCGTPTDWELAKWFAGLWTDYGRPGWHIRRVHYVATQSGALKRDGITPYVDKDPKGWAELNEGSQAARILGLVDPELFSDKRTEAVSQNVVACEEPAPDPRAEVEEASIWGPWLDVTAPQIKLHDAALDLPGILVNDAYDYRDGDQPVMLEAWAEKSTVNDVLVPLCRELDVNLKIGKGFESITAAIALLRRAEQYGHRRVHVLYIADLDRNGRMIPVVLARHCQYWAQKLDIDVHVTVERLALTPEQVEQYGLPQAPDSEDTELDALEALRPGVLAQLVRDAVEPWRDRQLAVRLQGARQEAEDQAWDEWSELTGDLAGESEELEVEAQGIARQLRDEIEAQLRPAIDAINAEMDRLRQDAEARLAPLCERAERIRDQVHDRIEDFEPDLPDRPEADRPDVDTTSMLYDSRRDWLDQLAAYRDAKRSAA